MPDLPIAPDESGDVPLCVASCARARWFDRRLLCDSDNGRHYPHRAVCHPRVRELVALSRRRCDGCAWWRETPAHDDGIGHCAAHDQTRRDGESCSRWEAKP